MPISPVKIADIEACIIGAKVPPLWRWRIPLGRTASEVNIAWDMVSGFIKANPGAATFDMVPIDPRVGDRITHIGARVLGTGSGLPVVIRLFRNNGDGTTRSLMATLTINAPPASWATYTVPLTQPEVVADGRGYVFAGDIPTTNQAIALLGYLSDRL